MNTPPQVGEYVITYRPTTNQPWNQFCQVGIVEQPDDNPATWNGQNSEAEYLFRTEKVKVRLIRPDGSPVDQPRHEPVSALIPTTRTMSFLIESAADCVACFGEIGDAYTAIFAMAGSSGKERRAYWKGELAIMIRRYPPRFGEVAGAAFLGYYDAPWLNEQWDIWYTYDMAGPTIFATIVDKNGKREEASHKGANQVADMVWHRFNVHKLIANLA